MFDQNDLITISLTLPASKLDAVYALLGGVSSAAVATPLVNSGNPVTAPLRGSTASAAESQLSASSPSASVAGTETTPVAAASSEASTDGELDAGGWPWSADMHASTRAKTGAGLWRMKPGVSRPDPKPGFTGTAETSAPVSEPVTSTTAAVVDEDEFAAFRAAAGQTTATAAPSVRTWADADLSKLCNQAAMKVGGPDGVKALIAKFVPAGETQHSRSIPAEQREAFAKEVEATHGIVYEG